MSVDTPLCQLEGLEQNDAFSVSSPNPRTSERQPEIQQLLGKPPTSVSSQRHSVLKPKNACSSLLDRTDSAAAAAAAKSLQSCPTLCDPTDGSPPGSPVPGILQARTLEWDAISFSNT